MTCNDLSFNCLIYSKIHANLQQTGKQFTYERGLRNDTSFPPSFRAIPDDQPQDITPVYCPSYCPQRDSCPFPPKETDLQPSSEHKEQKVMLLYTNYQLSAGQHTLQP
jgi:hypothetical protein